MKLVEPYFEILEQPLGLDGVYKMVEIAGRTCYKSEDRITADSAKEFANRMIDSGHGAMLEHGTVYLKDYYDVSAIGSWRKSLGEKYFNNKYSKVVKDTMSDMRGIYITTNLRVLVENGWLHDLKYLCEQPTKYHEKRVCVKFHLDRVTGESFLRHRVFSFARESTRYCNYSKNKFNHEITFVKPTFLNGKWDDDNDLTHDLFRQSCEQSETYYFSLIDEGCTAQQARQVLSFSLYSPLVMTGFVSDWKHFFDLRCDSHAHPDAQYLANGLKKEFIKRGYIND